MPLTVSFAAKFPAKCDCAIFAAGRDLKPDLSALSKGAADLVRGAIKSAKNFKGESGQALSVPLPKNNFAARAIVIGLGDLKKADAVSLEKAGGRTFPPLNAAGAESAAIFLPKKLDGVAAHFALGLRLRSYTYHAYKGKDAKAKLAKKPKPKKVTVIAGKTAAASKHYKRLAAGAGGVEFARDLVNMPPNDLYPDSYAKTIAKELKPLGVQVEILDDKKMKTLGMGAALAVGQGSARKPRMVVMKWNGAKGKAKSAPIAFVGKGVTFDTGGISIKPSAGMEDMKMDMGGSAAVVGLMKALATRKSRANVVAIVGLAENMPSHNAYRPGDVITSMAGKTIEVLNTDAEGRLVLADALTYVQKKHKPKMIIDLATLTGAIMVGLGFEYCGVFANDDKLWGAMEKASEKTGEKIWRMPLDEAYRKEMESNIADLKNLGSLGRWGGACSAAGFLEHFIDEKVTWSHWDIAGTAWNKSDKPVTPKGGTGFAVRALDQLVEDSYE